MFEYNRYLCESFPGRPRLLNCFSCVNHFSMFTCVQCFCTFCSRSEFRFLSVWGSTVERGPFEQGPTQNLGALVGAVGQGPVRGPVVPVQLDVELSSERLVGPPGDQLTALEPTNAHVSHDCLMRCLRFYLCRE